MPRSKQLVAILSSLVLLVFAGCVSHSATNTGELSAKPKVGFIKIADVIYTPASWPAPLKADLYQPKSEGLRPGVLLIYGGSWNSSDHRWQMSHLARKLAGRGFVVMNAAYRGTPEFRYPAPVDDLREALRWLRHHSAEYQVAPNRIAAYGFSAGGHLAALLGTQDGPPDVRVQAVVAASAPSDLTLFHGGEIIPKFLGATFEANPALYREASPINHVTRDDPPFFLYHGIGDTTVPPDHTRALKAALDRAGVYNEVRWVEGRGHATNLIFSGKEEDSAIDFLLKVLK